MLIQPTPRDSREGLAKVPPGDFFSSAAGDKWDYISIAANGDIPTYADSGSGTVGDPWIIQDYIIDCNSTGIGIDIQNTDEYIILRNCTVNESANAADKFNLLIASAEHVTVENCDFSDSGYSNVAIIVCDDINITSTNIIDSAKTGIHIDSSTNLKISNVTLDTSTTNGIMLWNYYSGENQDILIDNCSFSGDSILISMLNGTRITINNSTFETATDSGVAIQSTNTVTITNSNFTSTTIGVSLKGVSYNTFSDNRFTNLNSGVKTTLGSNPHNEVSENIFVNVDNPIYFTGSDNITIVNNIINDTLNHGIYLYNDPDSCNVSGNIITNSSTGIEFNDGGANNLDNHVIYNNMITDAYDNAMVFNNLRYSTIECNTMFNVTDSYMVNLRSGCVSNTIFNNTFNYTHKFDLLAVYDDYNNISRNYFENADDAGVWLDTGVSHTTIANNTFYRNLNHQGVLIYGGSTNISILGNNFTTNKYAIQTSSPVTVKYNWFDNNTYITDGGTFSYNYYRDYFDYFPYAVTDLNRNVLEYEYQVTGAINDSSPCYYAPWFKISEELAFHFYSNLDYLGLTFEWVKLYMDDAVTVRMDPIEDDLVFKVTVTDFAGTELYEAMHNANQTLDLDIGLNITIVQIKNKFDQDVLFHLVINGLTVGYPIAGESEYSLRMSLGSCSYWVTDLYGNTLEDVNGDDIVETKEIDGPDVISFGFIVVQPEDIDDDDSGTSSNPYVSYWALLPWIGMFIVVVAILAAVRSRNAPSSKQVSRASPRPSRSYRGSRV